MRKLEMARCSTDGRPPEKLASRRPNSRNKSNMVKMHWSRNPKLVHYAAVKQRFIFHTILSKQTHIERNRLSLGEKITTVQEINYIKVAPVGAF